MQLQANIVFACVFCIKTAKNRRPTTVDKQHMFFVQSHASAGFAANSENSAGLGVEPRPGVASARLQAKTVQPEKGGRACG